MKRQLIIFFLFLLIYSAKAQNPSITLSLADTKELFLTKNLSLLAARYDIEMAQAEILQARLFENPVISLEHNIYNRVNKRYFDFGKDSESSIEIEQIIYLAGQRNKRVNFEKVNLEIAQYQFEELLRTLSNELNEKFIQIYFLTKSLEIYNTQTGVLENLLSTVRIQEEKGNISKLERTRLEALSLSLHKEKNELESELITQKGEFKFLLSIPAEVEINLEFNPEIVNGLDSHLLSYADLKLLLFQRPDLKLARAETKASQANLKVQRSLAAPEFALKGSYDRVGNFYDNYFALGMSLSIPLFNRNQGGIKAAKLAIHKHISLEEQEMEKADMELFEAYQQFYNKLELYQAVHPQQLEEFETLLKGINDNFRKRNISMLEFIDYYESYKDMWIQILETQQNLFLAMENLNTTAGQIIFQY